MLDEQKFSIHIYEKNAATGRKFLVAGDGGFNLTHSEDVEKFVTRYTPPYFLEKALRTFTNKDLCNWLSTIGIETYTGSSKRIFPKKGIKPIEVLNAFLKKLKTKNTHIHTQHVWLGWEENNALKFFNQGKEIVVTADYVVFALGGASWSVTGSDGHWLNVFEAKGINTISFQASNCGYEVTWPDDFLEKSEGSWLKNISVSCAGHTKKGELVITKRGIEGGAIYALSPQIREQLITNKSADITIDFKPMFSMEDITQKLSGTSGKSVTQLLNKELKLSVVQIDLLKAFVSKEDFIKPERLAVYIKQFPVSVTDTASVDEAISTVGGVCLTEIDRHFQLNKLSRQFVIGEMLNWDAPTGGYLLQACFSMGAHTAFYLNGLK